MSALSTAAPPRRNSSFLRSVRAAILLDLEPELLLCEKVAVLQDSGYRHSDLVRMLGETPAALRSAEVRVKHAAERLGVD